MNDKKWYSAFSGLFTSRKFIFCMIIFVPCIILCWFHRMDGGSLAAVVATIGSVFLTAHTVSDVKSMGMGGKL